MQTLKIFPGKPHPLGPTWDGKGTNFALFSENATSVELLLFDSPESAAPAQMIRLREVTGFVWHCYVSGVGPGQLYAYRVHGPYEPERGLRFNPAKALVDPYARAIAGTYRWDDALFAYRIGDPAEDLSKDERDSAPFVPKCVVVDSRFDWGKDRQLNIPWHETIIYEVHVKGLTARHPKVDPALRGTYAGLASPPVIKYLKNLGVTAVELLPIHERVDDRGLIERGLTNYWGYNTLNFFAPDSRYSGTGILGQQVNEFKNMVKALHKAGLEVILDVVYNHTAEGNHLGPTFSFRGIDNPAYYRLVADQPRYYMDYTGCGNTLNMMHPRVLQLIMDSLRYWITEMHVDGFRFDLAAALARELHEVDRLGAFFDIIQQDPIISQVKLIAEPWDLGEGGYQVGNFPVGWAEWNGKYRDSIRQYWKGDPATAAELATRICGSSDLYEQSGRRPYASINFITAHDGFTLNDLVSYNDKHNEANGEGNRDGHDHNISWNCGEEGQTKNKGILELRERQKRNFLATLLFSQGVPMICGGDEIGRTQHGNNNAYCQDSEISWYDWELTKRHKSLLNFTQRLIQFWRAHPNLRRRKFFQGRKIRGTDVKDIIWLRPDGQEMSDDDWNSSHIKVLGLRQDGQDLGEFDEEGRPIRDDTLLMLFNAHHETVPFKLPSFVAGVKWQLVFDTCRPDLEEGKEIYPGAEVVQLRERSFMLLKFEIPKAAGAS